MPGTFTLDDPGIVLSQPATPVAVFKFDPTSTDAEDRYRLLPNVVCDHISRGIGAVPPAARFHYLLDNSGVNPDWPSQFDEIWPQTARATQYVVVTDDRIAVIAWTPQGERRMLFDGFAQIPQVNLSGDRQMVSFVASGVAIRAWDVPIPGRKQRDGDDPEGGPTIQTDLPVRLNPSDGKGGVLPNCTPDDHDEDEDDPTISYPVFMEQSLERSASSRTLWTVEKAARYILRTQNADEKYILNPSMQDLTDLLQVRTPSPVDGVIDPADSSTYTVKDMPLRDVDLSNQPWPEALQSLLASIGFGFFFRTPRDTGDADSPTTPLYIYRLDSDKRTPKTVLLDDYESTLDPGKNDVAGLALARDVNHVVNAFSVETPVKQWEVSIILAPGFTPSAGDESGNNRSPYLKSKLGDADSTIARKYRWYVGDECADGHWDGTSFVTNVALDLTPLFPDDDKGNPTYVRRYRPGSHKLITLDQAGKPRKALLHYSQDYSGAYPAVWNGTGTWKPIAAGWNVLEKRLGIQITIEDVEMWHTGNGKELIKGITWQANPPMGSRFFLMLTTIIDDDIMLESVVPARIASPTKYERRRRIDARDHYQFQGVATPSWFNQGTDDVIVRDDTEKALALGRQYRSAHEMPPLSGTIMIPYITNYYELGDKISTIEGREVSLKANAAGDKGEADRLPTVVKISWDFSGDRQTTTLHLTDLRAEVQA